MRSERKMAFGSGERRHRRWVMAERLRGKTTGRWEAGRAVCAWGKLEGRDVKV